MSDAARTYWDAQAGAAAFTHPLEMAWLAPLGQNARLLDFGCGYGRTLAGLKAAGWRNTVGVDLSGEMIARGRAADPGLDLRQANGLPLGEPDGSFDGAILFAVLTTIADDAGQAAVIGELRRLLKPGGLLYLSDYLLQSGPRYGERYRLGLERYGVMGVWTREDGGVFRHQTREGLDALLATFELVKARQVETRTLSGAPATAIQRLVRRPA